MSKKDLDRRLISELQNLGPKCERDLAAVGIKTAADLRQLGVKEAFTRVVIGRLRRNESIASLSLNYLYALHGALHETDWRALSEETKREYRVFLDELRTDGPLSRRSRR